MLFWGGGEERQQIKGCLINVALYLPEAQRRVVLEFPRLLSETNEDSLGAFAEGLGCSSTAGWA